MSKKQTSLKKIFESKSQSLYTFLLLTIAFFFLIYFIGKFIGQILYKLQF